MPRNGIKMTHFLRNNLGTILPKNTRAVKKKLLRSSWRIRYILCQAWVYFEFKITLLYEYRDLFIDMAVRNNRSELAIAIRHQER